MVQLATSPIRNGPPHCEASSVSQNCPKKPGGGHSAGHVEGSKAVQRSAKRHARPESFASSPFNPALVTCSSLDRYVHLDELSLAQKLQRLSVA